MLSVLLAVLAAVANGLASVLQRKAARDRPEDESLSWRLIWHLLHRPVWFAGIASIIAGFLLQAVALGKGRISVVESLLVLDLPVALILSSRLLHARLRTREWAATAAMAVGLAGLLFSLAPSEGSSADVSGLLWAAGLSANVLLIAVGVWWARLTTKGTRKAAILGTATSCGFGLTAALIKGVTATSSHGIGGVFTSWQLYGMIVAGAGSLFLLQSAVHAGPLLAAQPGLSMADPVISILWGTLVFDETVRGGPAIALAAVAAAVVGAAVVVLAHSPLLTDRPTGPDRPGPVTGEPTGSPGERR
ncbi:MULTISPECIES: DMT family transporter [unclassified Streptomyces]|uniref:DMT family transporter n=1 Tax=unclassified Streptomyces TaxID=2593676 RepID=UPI0036A9A35D